MKRILVTLLAATAILFGSASAVSATPAAKAAALPQQLVRITQGSGPMFLDAWETSNDYNVVLRPYQNNSSQQWWLIHESGSVYRLMQASSGRYLDAHEIAGLDYRVVTRPYQNNTTQQWRLWDYGGGFYEIQHVSSGRYLDAYTSVAQDFQVVTRPRNYSNTQTWRIGNP